MATLLCLFGYFYFYAYRGDTGTALLVYSAGAILDSVDGRIARRHSQENPDDLPPGVGEPWFFYPGCSEQGALWDSSQDKLRIFLVYSHAIWISYAEGMPVVAMLFAKVLIVDTFSGIRRLMMFKARQKTGENHSKMVGKVKAWVQQLTLLPLVLREEIGYIPLIIFLVASLVLTVGSIAARMIKKRS